MASSRLKSGILNLRKEAFGETFKSRLESLRKEADDEPETFEEPFAGYDDFADCVSKNQDKSNPEAYCAQIHKNATGKWPAEEGAKKGPGNPDGTGPGKDDPECPYKEDALKVGDIVRKDNGDVYRITKDDAGEELHEESHHKEDVNQTAMHHCDAKSCEHYREQEGSTNCILDAVSVNETGGCNQYEPVAKKEE